MARFSASRSANLGSWTLKSPSCRKAAGHYETGLSLHRCALCGRSPSSEFVNDRTAAGRQWLPACCRPADLACLPTAQARDSTMREAHGCLMHRCLGLHRSQFQAMDLLPTAPEALEPAPYPATQSALHNAGEGSRQAQPRCHPVPSA